MTNGYHFVKVRMSDIVNGEFVKQDEQSFVRTKSGKELSRVRILGYVVEKFVSNDGNYAVLTLDDSTETLRAKFFQQYVSSIKDVNVGDLIDIYGFLREYEGEVYLAPLITKKTIDPNYEVLRKLELGAQELGGTGAQIEGAAGEPPSELDLEAAILMKIAELDTGAGVKIVSLIQTLKLSEDRALELIRNLLIKGDLYEPKKGIVKRID